MGELIQVASSPSNKAAFTDDLSAFSGDESATVELLLERLEDKAIYTWVGTLLLVLNPGKQYLQLYDESQQKLYIEQRNIESVKSMQPHIYAVAKTAQYRLVNGLGKICQVIVISGESGTGKTFNARKALEFIAKNNEKSDTFGASSRDILHKIGNIYPLVSAFSTARTARNDKSSRHGQLVRLEYEKNGTICGASINSFLLERTRATVHSNNFEIFYQLLFGLSDCLMDQLFLSRNGNYTILGDLSTREGESTADEFRQTVNCLDALGFTDQCKNDIFRIIGILVHLGNIKFKGISGEACTVDLVNEESRQALKNACSLLSLEEYALTELLTSTIICPPSSRVRHTSYRRDLKTPEDCRNRLFGIIRYIYDRLFNWLVDRLNHTLSACQENRCWLGILDIFGFESFDFNGLEQLCVNYATERLQLYFMGDYLESAQMELQEEGLEVLPQLFHVQIYRERLFVIEDVVFKTFNDASRSPIPPKGSTLHQQLQEKATRKEISRFLTIKNDAFVIEHYSCPVEYNVNNLLSRNTDKVPTELSSVFGKSKNKLLLELLENGDGSSSECRVSPKKSTTLAKLERSLDCLVSELNKCDSHYVRCARPRLVEGSWAKQEFEKQLAGTGIFDALSLARCKLPVRFPREQFFKRYSIEATDSSLELLESLKKILASKDLSESIHFGKRLVFLTDAIFAELEKYRKNLRFECARKIQSYWMRARKRRCMKNSGGSSGKIQTTFISSKYEDEDFATAQQVQENNNFGKETNAGNHQEESQNDFAVEVDQHSFSSQSDASKHHYVDDWLENNQLKNELRSTDYPREMKKLHVQKLPRDMTLTLQLNKHRMFYRNRIISRHRPVEIPIRFHTRATCLPYSHCPPKSLRPRGLEDCLFES